MDGRSLGYGRPAMTILIIAAAFVAIAILIVLAG